MSGFSVCNLADDKQMRKTRRGQSSIAQTEELNQLAFVISGCPLLSHWDTLVLTLSSV